MQRLLLSFMLGLIIMAPLSHANDKADWDTILPAKTSDLTLKKLAERHAALFDYFVKNSLQGKGKKVFNKVKAKVATNMRWLNSARTNDYNEAFKRSYPFVSTYDLKGMPDSIFLLAYMESQWHGKRGNKSADYGYWQMVPEVLSELKTLPYLPSKIRGGHLNKIREHELLSTQAAQAHLHRYHFYFAKVAQYSETDSWLLTFTAFNWGAGNVKRLMEQVVNDGLEANYSNFYYYLYQLYQKTPDDRSLRAAVEYVPKLWHLAQLIHEVN
ncbi:transglycosylase SLT domain-containing protein [Thiofilum flexile]|uniref:transglycosylase SLT domain-containing protein n=1 Tax=Thiofilum flexile TaxID=125627 RepID=UPI000369209E|nr:transglycosylase SLT domain-containing protein [Thiofilum flexile]